MSVLAWVNGAFVGERAGISADDAGLARGIGAFETLGARGGELPLWHRHLSRLRGAARVLEIDWTWEAEALRDAARELLRCRGHGDGVLRLTLTAGVRREPSLCMTTRARSPVPRPVRLALAAVRRPAVDPTAGIKTTSRAFLELARRHVDADDALLADERDRMLEATRWNVFVVAPDRIRTPSVNAPLLPGVARAALLEALGRRGTPVAEEEIALSELHPPLSLVVTNAVSGPQPAVLSERRLEPPSETVVQRFDASWESVLDEGLSAGR